MSLRRNTLWNLAGSGVPLIAAALLIPYTLHRLGDSAFGVLTLIWAVIGYFSLFDMGVGRALTFEISRMTSAGEATRLRPTLQGGLFLTAAAGGVGALILVAIAPSLVRTWLKVHYSLQDDALLALRMTSIGILATTLTSGIRGAMEGLGHFGMANMSKVVLGLCMFALPALSVHLHGPSLSIISVYLVGARVLVAIAAAFQLRHRLMEPGDNFNVGHLRPLFNYGFWITVTGIVGPLMVYGDRFFVSATVGISELPFYSIPQEGLQRLLILPAALCGALLPRLAGSDAEQRSVVYRSNYRRISVLMFCICAAVSAIAYPVLSWWITEEFARRALPIVWILSIGIWANSLAMAPYTLLHAAGHPRITALFHLLELVLYVAALWWLTAHFSLAGAAAAWVLRAVLDLALLHVAARRIVLYPR
jgi:O-antigen/teichoic acid export membrane protein